MYSALCAWKYHAYNYFQNTTSSNRLLPHSWVGTCKARQGRVGVPWRGVHGALCFRSWALLHLSSLAPVLSTAAATISADLHFSSRCRTSQPRTSSCLLCYLTYHTKWHQSSTHRDISTGDTYHANPPWLACLSSCLLCPPPHSIECSPSLLSRLGLSFGPCLLGIPTPVCRADAIRPKHPWPGHHDDAHNVGQVEHSKTRRGGDQASCFGRPQRQLSETCGSPLQPSWQHLAGRWTAERGMQRRSSGWVLFHRYTWLAGLVMASLGGPVT